ncbi:MAG: hypothetical protein HPY74_13215 [Firmicutes bacterium]|nr:hypothetical protein [Bacillota bacterium]
MLYRRYPLIHRKYMYPGPRHVTKRSSSDIQEEKLKDDKKKAEEIPLPNELEHIPGPGSSSQTGPEVINKSRENSAFPFLNIFSRKIQFEEIVILGLIFLLLNEEIRDDILLVVLIYILLT